MKNIMRSSLLLLLIAQNIPVVSMQELTSEESFSNRAKPHKYVIGHWSGGMGICITSVLNHLLYCEYRGRTPVVYWNRSLYHNPQGFNNKKNEWEYYFNPVSNLSFAPGDTIHYACGEKEGAGRFSYYDTSQEKRDLAYGLISRYVHLNAIVKNKVDQFYNTHMAGKNTIGIHLRGTDKHTEEKPVPPEVIVAEALKHANEDTQFFIATDEQRLLDAMIQLLNGRKVVHYGCYRSENGAPLHIPKKTLLALLEEEDTKFFLAADEQKLLYAVIQLLNGIKISRDCCYRSENSASLHTRKKPSVAQVGEDVIVEMWLMSKCDMLIHTLSNVSSIPLYINPNMPHITMR